MSKHEKKASKKILCLLATAVMGLFIYRKSKKHIEKEKSEPELTSENGYFVI